MAFSYNIVEVELYCLFRDPRWGRGQETPGEGVALHFHLLFQRVCVTSIL